MKLNLTMLAILAGISLFVGFVIVAVGIGAIFPSMHKLTAPLICGGEVEVESIRYSYKPGQVGWEHHIYCIEAGNEKEITFQAIGVSGLVASAILFALFATRSWKKVVLPGDFGEPTTDFKPNRIPGSARGRKKEGTRLERLAELKQMYESNLITKEEYEKKKARIIDEL
ncbi:MAG: SHOCT domain-containing protein [Chloroflexi bacterium]|nr:SHOCT domain-containing protein [Chloroflexota bacterium]